MPLKPGLYALVFGHTRFAAFQLLHKRHPNEPKFARLPLYKERLTDRQMFAGGVSKNTEPTVANQVHLARSACWLMIYTHVIGVRC